MEPRERWLLLQHEQRQQADGMNIEDGLLVMLAVRAERALLDHPEQGHAHRRKRAQGSARQEARIGRAVGTLRGVALALRHERGDDDTHGHANAADALAMRVTLAAGGADEH